MSMYKKIKIETLDMLRRYLVDSILPSRDVQQLLRLLNEAETIEEKKE